jgi:Phage capsid family
MNTRTRSFPEPVRASVARALADYYDELGSADASLAPAQRFSLVKVLQDLNAGAGVRDGFEREVCGGLATIQGRHHDPERPMLPWPALAVRDLTASVAASGGYLVGTTPTTAVDVLRGFSVVADAGMTILEGLLGNVTVPTVGTSATTGAAATEATPATESTPAFGSIGLTPKTLIGYVELSRLMALQVPSLEAFMRAHLLRVVGELLDRHVLYGSGVSGQVTGLLNTNGVVAQSGSSLSWAGIRAMRKASIAAGARETELAWIGAPDVQETLSGRERFAGAGAIWDDNGIGARPAYPTKVAQAGSLIVGPWSSAALGLWGGVQIEYNPYAGFQTGIKAARVVLSADLAVTNAGAFGAATSVT